MRATEFCKFFDFTLVKEHGFVPGSDDLYAGTEYNYIATDNHGVFQPRYVMDVNELTDMFDSCLKDYIDDMIEEDGFEVDEHYGAYYDQAYEWAKENETYKEYYPTVIEALEALAKGELEDDTEVST